MNKTFQEWKKGIIQKRSAQFYELESRDLQQQ